MTTATSPPPATRHPDLFDPVEAMTYLHLPTATPEEIAAGDRTLKTLREAHGLAAQKLGARLFYHREDLDAVVSRLFAKSQRDDQAAAKGPRLRLRGAV